MFGSHLSVAGGLEHALAEAKALGCDCVQIFTRNQRRWDNPPISKDEIARWKEGLAALGWDQPGPSRVVSHNSYLVNLAAPSGETRTRSIKAQRQELERCEALGIELCVAHPGAHLGEAPSKKTPLPLGEPPSDDELAGLERIVEALDRIHRDLPGFRVRTLLETTVGSGTNLGYDFGHLAMIRERVAEPDRVGFCFDTCHVTAAGWDMTTPTKAAAVLARFDATCGLARIGAFHMNDSKGAVGSRLDRHAHIGEGTCGRACFRAICGDARFASIPKILETPKELDADQVPWDAVNLKRLRAMSRAPKAASKSGVRASRPKDAEARRGSRGSAKPARTGGRRKA
ncbi:MAG: deoxyribonuclease IV [Phycisphaerales bacterium]